MLLTFLILRLAPAHPSVDGHLHAVEVTCTTPDGQPVADPMPGTVAAIRRAGVLTDAGRTEDALAELDRACLPDAEVTRLARARTLLRAQRPQDALGVLDGLTGTDADMWRAEALLAAGREDEAGRLLLTTLNDLPEAPPEAYLEAGELVPPCQAVDLFDLALTRKGDVGSLRRGRAGASFHCGHADALEALHLDDTKDQLLAGDLLAEAGRTEDARAHWAAAMTLLEDQRDTPAKHRMSKTLLQRLEAPTDTP